jgi:hypothetical protein
MSPFGPAPSLSLPPRNVTANRLKELLVETASGHSLCKRTCKKRITMHPRPFFPGFPPREMTHGPPFISLFILLSAHSIIFLNITSPRSLPAACGGRNDSPSRAALFYSAGFERSIIKTTALVKKKVSAQSIFFLSAGFVSRNRCDFPFAANGAAFECRITLSVTSITVACPASPSRLAARVGLACARRS